MTSRLALASALTVAALAVPTPGQVLVEELLGVRQVVEVGDIDADGVPDRAGVDLDGKVLVLLGGSGRVASTYTPSTLGGNILAAPGDLDGDGWPDLILGEPDYGAAGSLVGRLAFLSPITGSEFASTLADGLAQGGRMGSSLVVLPDLDGDGAADVATGAPHWPAETPGTGLVRIVSGATGAWLASFAPAGVPCCDEANRFGDDLAVADVTGDGVPELVVAMPGEPGSSFIPRVQAFDLATLVGGGITSSSQALVMEVVGPVAGWGDAVASAGDIDGDGRDDLLIGAPVGVNPSGSADPGPPRARIHSGADGSLLAELLAPGPTAGFGTDVAGLGDVDLDGVPDLLVAGPGSGSPLGIGRAVVFSGADGSVLFDVIGLSGASGAFGTGVDVFADVTGDGVAEFQVRDDFEGLVRLYSSLGVIETFGLALAGAAGEPSLSAEGSVLPGSALAIELLRGPPRAPVFFVIGLGLSSTPFLGGTMGPETVAAITGWTTDGAGELSLDARWPEGLPSATFYVQAWMLDPTGPQGASASNALGLSQP